MRRLRSANFPPEARGLDDKVLYLLSLGRLLGLGLQLLLGRRGRFRQLHAPARLLDRFLGSLARCDAVHLEGFLDLAREDDLGARGAPGDEPRLLQAREVDLAALHLREVARANLGRLHDGRGEKAALGKAPLQRHLPALEAHLVEAARARLLALVAAARGLAQA